MCRSTLTYIDLLSLEIVYFSIDFFEGILKLRQNWVNVLFYVFYSRSWEAKWSEKLEKLLFGHFRVLFRSAI